MRLRAPIFACCSILAASLVADSASAACTRLAFSVNDYGKAGPTKDAKDLLDKYIARWASERGIKKYATGKKDVTCELFLDVGLFDEHTCKAAASVCWDGPMPAGVTTAAAGTKAGAPKSAVVKKAAAKPVPAPVTTGSIPAPAAAAPKPQ